MAAVILFAVGIFFAIDYLSNPRYEFDEFFPPEKEEAAP